MFGLDRLLHASYTLARTMRDSWALETMDI